MSAVRPCLSIGLPVYNGERYIARALDSISNQSFEDYEIIISDNASTDRTVEICQEYAARDRRVRLFQNQQNVGATKNYNRVFELAGGKYFKWAAHDDELAVEFLSKCVTVLDQDSEIILCHTKSAMIDEQSLKIGSYESKVNWNAATPQERFHDLVLSRHPCTAIFGVVRSEVLRRTPLIGNFVGSDRNLLAELGLLGRIYEVPEYLFFRRDHSQASISKYDEYERLKWFDPNKTGRIHLPYWRNGLEYFNAVRRVPLRWPERLICYRYAAFWFKRERKSLLRDIEVAFYQMLPGSFNRKIHHKVS